MDRVYLGDLKRFINDWIYFSYHKHHHQINQEINNSISNEISSAINFSVDNINYLLNFICREVGLFKNKTLLEIGAGQDFGISLVLADLGLKQVVIVDPFLVEWNDDYHPQFYRELLKQTINQSIFTL